MVDGEILCGWSANKRKMAQGGGEYGMSASVVIGSRTMGGIVTSIGELCRG